MYVCTFIRICSYALAAHAASILPLTLTRRFWFLAPLIKSRHTFSKERTFLEVRVIRMRCTDVESPPWGFSISLGAAAYKCREASIILRLCYIRNHNTCTNFIQKSVAKNAIIHNSILHKYYLFNTYHYISNLSGRDSQIFIF